MSLSRPTLWLTVALAIAHGLSPARGQDPPAQDSILIKDVHVVDVASGKLLRDHGVLIEGDRIVRLGPTRSFESISKHARPAHRCRCRSSRPTAAAH